MNNIKNEGQKVKHDGFQPKPTPKGSKVIIPKSSNTKSNSSKQ